MRFALRVGTATALLLRFVGAVELDISDAGAWLRSCPDTQYMPC